MAIDKARLAALALLDAVILRQQMLSEALPGALAGLSAPQAARAQRLAHEVLRQLPRADQLLEPWLQRRPGPELHNLLRLGAVELGLGGAPYGVVNAAVDLARARAPTRRAAGMVNAVLRKVAAGAPALVAMEAPRLPEPLRARLVAAWGRAAIRRMEVLLVAAPPPFDLTPRAPAKVEALAARLRADATVAGPEEGAAARGNAPAGGTQPESASNERAAAGDAWAGGAETGSVPASAFPPSRAVELLPTGSLRLRGVQVSALPGHAEGAFWVQDAAAALPARVLAPREGERVLDLCAAPGGKALQLAAAGARVTALDISAPRLERLRENLVRTGLGAWVEVVQADALDWQDGGGGFDAILLDAPCSATGTLRRHPDLPFLRARTELAPLLSLQARLADRAHALLRPGGRLVVCTCSLFPEEGEKQARALQERHSDLRPDAHAVDLPGCAPFAALAGNRPGELRTAPWLWDGAGQPRDGIDGFHIAAFVKEPA